MTILGVIVEPDRAVMWCDSETYRGGQPVGHAAKMSANPLAGVVIGTGSIALIRQAATSLQSSASIDALERRLPNDMRQRAAKLAPDLMRVSLSWCSGQTVIAVGYSDQAQRMVGWRFAGAAFFEPHLVSRFCVPTDADLEVKIQQATNIRDLSAIARRQLEIVRQQIPTATGGSLSVAELTEVGLHFQTIPDFDVTEATAPAVVHVE